GMTPAPLPDNGWSRCTWTGRWWSPWIGTAEKNAAWNALRKTREALEAYKNSGRASVQRLDMAFEQMYTAENANYFYTVGNNALSSAVVEERQHDFIATLSTVYRLMGQPPPDDLTASTTPTGSPVSLSSTT